MPSSPKAPILRPKLRGKWAVPISHSPGEVRGFEERARYMLDVAPRALAPVQPGDKAGFQRQIKRVPLGVVAVVAPWNFSLSDGGECRAAGADRG